MKLEFTTCYKCILEEILKDYPDYKLERWGYMPIWAEYRDKSKVKLCVTAGDIERESCCLFHLFNGEYD